MDKLQRRNTMSAVPERRRIWGKLARRIWRPKPRVSMVQSSIALGTDVSAAKALLLDDHRHEHHTSYYAACSRRAYCERCESLREHIARLQREIERMRQLIINDAIVTQEPPKNIHIPEEAMRLAQESAKLRITIDSLCRFEQWSESENR